MGNAGIQPGLAIFPGEVVEADLEHQDPTRRGRSTPRLWRALSTIRVRCLSSSGPAPSATAGPRPPAWCRVSSAWTRKADVRFLRPMPGSSRWSPRPSSPTSAASSVHLQIREHRPRARWRCQTPARHAIRFSIRNDPADNQGSAVAASDDWSVLKQRMTAFPTCESFRP